MDHGLYETLPSNVRLTLCEFWEKAILLDEPQMEILANRIGIKNPMHFAQVLFQQPLRINGRIKSQLTHEDIEHIQRIAKQNFDQIMDTLREMPRNMLFVVR
mgnify:CR=1 FL=1